MLRKIAELMQRWDSHVIECVSCALYQSGQKEKACEYGNTIVRELLQLLG